MSDTLLSLARGARARLARLPWPLILTAVVALVLVALVADEALARSGGSSGGSRFRSSSGGGWGGGSSWGGGSGYRGGGHYGGGFYFFGFGIPWQLIVAVIVVAVIGSIVQNLKKKAAEATRVYRLRFAMEMPGGRPWEALEQVVRGARRGRHGDDLAAQCRDVALFLRRQGDKVTHACIAGDGLRLGFDQAEATFNALSGESRRAFNREVLRIEDGGHVRETKREVDGLDGLHDEDGDFGINEFFAVTLVVALRGRDSALKTPLSTQADLEAMLARLSSVTEEEVMACEVVWEPAAESDALTSDDMLVTYPELTRLL
jgi:uncharacterized membrane protein